MYLVGKKTYSVLSSFRFLWKSSFQMLLVEIVAHENLAELYHEVRPQ